MDTDLRDLPVQKMQMEDNPASASKQEHSRADTSVLTGGALAKA